MAPRSRTAAAGRGMTRDFRYAWRVDLAAPGPFWVIVATLAIALAANSTTFSLLDALVLRPYRFVRSRSPDHGDDHRAGR